MSSRSLFVVISVFVASPILAQPGKPHIVYQPDYATAGQAAKKSGLSLMVVVALRDGQPPAPLADPKVIGSSRGMINVGVLPDSSVAKKLGLAPGEVLFLNIAGDSLGKIEAGFTAEQLIEKMTTIIGEYRAKAVETLKNEQESAANQKSALSCLSHLGADIPTLISLLGLKQADQKATVRKLLLARESEGADWALLKAMASAEADVRAACYPAAVEITKAGKTVPPLAFWKDSPEAERTGALAKWRELLYGNLPPLNTAVLEFSFEHYGKQVGAGECAHLATEALKKAGAQNIKHEGKTYIWGRALAPSDSVMAGDIVQLEDAKFSNGISASHHTQVIRRVLGPGLYEVLEQNFGGRRTVGIGKLNVKLLTAGTVVIFRPLSIENGKK